MSVDPAQTSFRKALDLTTGTISVLDRNAVALSRIWCCYELATSMEGLGAKHQYDVYTANEVKYS